jgi:TRAP-type mannitol/chloroaromatic compound transport system substrate-binding protein
MAERRGFSFAAGICAIVTALIFGIVVSLAIRPPGNVVIEAVAGGDAKVREQVHWRVPSAFGTNLIINGEMILHVADQLLRASGGSIVFEIFEPGELMPAFSITESVKDNKVPAGYTWLGYDQGKIPASALLASVPFGMEPMAFMAWWYEGGGRQLGEALYQEHNIQPVLCGVIGPETAGWFKQPIKSLEDLEGLKIRFSGLGGKVLQRIGASVTLIPAGEIFQALEKGAIDGTEFSSPAVDRMLGFDRVAKFNLFPGWHQPSSGAHLLVNLEVWNGLREDTRDMIEMACEANAAYVIARSESLQGEVIQNFPAVGVSAETLPLEVLQVLRETTQEVLAEEAAADQHFAEILASQQAFLAEYQYWKQLGYLPRDF